MKHYLITIGTSWENVYVHGYLMCAEDDHRKSSLQAVDRTLQAMEENSAPPSWLPIVLVTLLEEPKEVKRIFCRHDPEVAATIEAAVDFHFSVIVLSKKEDNEALLHIH